MIMANTSTQLFDEKKGLHLKDESLDLGENSFREITVNQEITPQQLEGRINDVQERERIFDQTGLENPEQKLLEEKSYQTKEKLALVQKPKLFEKEDETQERVNEKFKIVLDNLLRKMISTKKKFPELLSNLSSSLDDENVKGQREALEIALESLTQLKIDLRGVAQFYFSEGVAMLRDYRKAYKNEFDETIKPRIQEYYLRFGHSTQHVPSTQEFASILISDIVDITSGKYEQEGFTIEETEMKIARLLDLIEDREKDEAKQKNVITFEDQNRQEEEQQLTSELKDQANSMSGDHDTHEEQSERAA